MNDTWILTAGLLLPFAGTALGAAMVYVLPGLLPEKTERMLLGFAGGVMTAAAFYSLLLPAQEMAQGPKWMPVCGGFLLGTLFLLALDHIVPHMHALSDAQEGPEVPLKKTTKLFLAVTMHNLPEGMAAGAVLAGWIDGSAAVTMMSALALCVGIAVQNFPEGAILSMPLSAAMSKNKAFLYGAASGLVEPVGALVTLVSGHFAAAILPWLLSFAAGAMLYVTVEELIPQSQAGSHSNIPSLAFAFGFLLMTLLDTAL